MKCILTIFLLINIAIAQTPLDLKNRNIETKTIGQIIGEDHFAKQEYAEAIEYLKKPAENGDIDAQVLLAQSYFRGKLKQDYAEAFKWFKLAFDRGDERAQVDLGIFYYHGIGMKKNYAEAFKLWKLSAEQNQPHAQSNLAIMYENGYGVRQNIEEAKEWYGKACDNGNQNGCDKYRELNNK